MRLIPFITAALVTAALYLAVFERAALLAFARGDDTTVAAAQTEGATSAPVTVAEDGAPVIGVVVLQSLAQPIDSAVILRGQTKAARQVQVRAETTASVISEPLRKGSFVQKDDLLCRLDPGTREAMLAEARARLDEATGVVPATDARLNEARKRLREAEINWRAADKLIKDGFASETRLATTEANHASAQAALAGAQSAVQTTQAAIESATAAVAAAEREIDKLTIIAPFDGLLETDAAELGSLLQPGGLCATVIQLNPIKLSGFVPETEVDRVAVGARAGALLVTGRRVLGTVTYLSRSADPTTRTFEVEIEVANDDLSIRDGQTAEIAISSDGVQAHLLPQSALTLNNDGALGVRMADSDNIVRFASVTVLRDTVDGIWVGGLPAQADVIVVGQDFVTEGVRVKPTYRTADKPAQKPGQPEAGQ
jgi:multidrug efflux system membrane fusion protein